MTEFNQKRARRAYKRAMKRAEVFVLTDPDHDAKAIQNFRTFLRNAGPPPSPIHPTPAQKCTDENKEDR